MRCSVCGADGLCWYNAQRRLICRDCRALETREVFRASIIGQRRFWYRSDRGCGSYVPVQVEDTRGGWVIVRDDAGIQHRVRLHNLSVYAH